MKSVSFQLRWFNDACYEIKLPNGKGIVIDPHIDDSPYKILTSADVEAADYILISHTHFDHVTDVGKLSERFDSRIFVASQSGVALARQYDIPGYQLRLCMPGMTLYTPDFQLTCFAGQHTKIGEIDRPSRWPDNIVRDHLPADSAETNLLGSYEYLNYLLTFPDHTRLFVWGGAATPEACAQVRAVQPDFSIAQLPRETPAEIAALYAAIGGKFIFPHHHDSYIAKGKAGLEKIRQTVEETRKLAPYTQVVCPEKGKWYIICTYLDLNF